MNKKDLKTCPILSRHCNSSQHQACIGRWLAEQKQGDDAGVAEKPAEVADRVPCVGFSLTHGPHGTISKFKQEFQLWATHTNLGSCFSKHAYAWDIAKQELVIKHKDCKQVVLKGKKGAQACDACSNTTLCNNATKNVLRFAKKYWIARLLHSRLFRSDSATAGVIDEIKQTVYYRYNKATMDELISSDSHELQVFLRQNFSKMPKNQMSDIMHKFLQTVVQPCLVVCVTDCLPEFRQMAHQLSSDLACGKLSEFAQVSAKIAKAACCGTFSQKPAVMGLLCNFLDMLDREERGAVCMKGTRSMSEFERKVMQDATYMLALNGANADVMKYFGFNKEAVMRAEGKISSLLSQGLPAPALSLLFPSVMTENAAIIDGLSPRLATEKPRRWVLCWEACLGMQWYAWDCMGML